MLQRGVDGNPPTFLPLKVEQNETSLGVVRTISLHDHDTAWHHSHRARNILLHPKCSPCLGVETQEYSFAIAPVDSDTKQIALSGRHVIDIRALGVFLPCELPHIKRPQRLGERLCRRLRFSSLQDAY
jgi:hypothetical protein